MWLGVFDHGRMRVQRASKLRVQEGFRAANEVWLDMQRRGECEIVVVIPSMMQYECPKHIGRYAFTGVPCYAVTMQSSEPEIPQEWSKVYQGT